MYKKIILFFLICTCYCTVFCSYTPVIPVPSDYDFAPIPPLDTDLLIQERKERDEQTYDSLKKMVQDVVGDQSKKPVKKIKRSQDVAAQQTPKKMLKTAIKSLIINNALTQATINQEVRDILERQYHDPELEDKKISLTLKKVPIKEVISIISKSTGLQCIVDADVTGVIQDLQLDQVSLAAVLHSILSSNEPRLALIKDFGVWRVMKLQTARETFTGKAALQRERDFTATIVPIFYAKWNDALKNRIEKLWQGVTNSNGLDKQNTYIVFDEVNKKIFCKARKAQIEEFAKYIKAIDISIPQIRIEARIVLANKDFEESLGFNWSGVYNRRASVNHVDFIGLGPINKKTGDGTDKDTTPFNDILGWSMNFVPSTIKSIMNTINIPLIFGNKDMATKRLNLQLNAAESRSEIKTILKPSLLVYNDEAAEILVGEELPHDVRLDETIEGKLTNINTVTYKDVGMKITVKPLVAPDCESVFLDVYVENSRVTKSDLHGQGVGIIGTTSTLFNYTIRTSRSKNRVLLKSGQTTLIGGLIETTTEKVRTGVPYLQDVPVLGWLFKGKQELEVDKQVLIFITPTLVNI